VKFTPSEIYDLMRMRFLAGRVKRTTTAMDPIQFYGFKPEDVAVVHYPKRGVAYEGMWFCLKDGRTVNLQGKPCNPDPTQYETEGVTEDDTFDSNAVAGNGTAERRGQATTNMAITCF
jgi:hypothetical protein